MRIYRKIIRSSASKLCDLDPIPTWLITPLLKKVLLDPEVLKTFHPVSDITYLSKIIERVVVVRLINQCLGENGLH